MARKTKKSRQRNIRNITSGTLLTATKPTLKTYGQDDRYHHPKPKKLLNTRLRLAVIHRSRAQTSQARKTSYGPIVGPLKTLKRLVCKTRKIRKEVLHATKKTGKGGKRYKRKLTWKSRIKCG